MCGFSAWFAPEHQNRGVDALLRMHASIRHRGPDGQGFLLLEADGTVRLHATADQIPARPITAGLAFRRLGILDLSPAANQPMASPDRTLWIVFNGEIYNFRQLRRQLESQGHSFRTSGDTEVFLAAYEHWGTDYFERFEGMWAAVILDQRRHRLVATRDRFGIKPLHSFLHDGVLLLASEAKQIVAASDAARRPNRPLIEMFLRGQRYPFIEETFFEDVRGIAPASWAEWPLDEPPAAPRLRRYWQLSDYVADARPAIPYDDAVDRVEQTLVEAVASHSVADVPVGALLSGGLDSSTLVGLLARRLKRRVPTFSFGFRKRAPRFCEMPYVDQVVADLQLDNYETSLDGPWVRNNLDRAIWALEEPPLAMPALAQYKVFQLAAERGVTVVLDGRAQTRSARATPTINAPS